MRTSCLGAGEGVDWLDVQAGFRFTGHRLPRLPGGAGGVAMLAGAEPSLRWHCGMQKPAGGPWCVPGAAGAVPGSPVRLGENGGAEGVSQGRARWARNAHRVWAHFRIQQTVSGSSFVCGAQPLCCRALDRLVNPPPLPQLFPLHRFHCSCFRMCARRARLRPPRPSKCGSVRVARPAAGPRSARSRPRQPAPGRQPRLPP